MFVLIASHPYSDPFASLTICTLHDVQHLCVLFAHISSASFLQLATAHVTPRDQATYQTTTASGKEHAYTYTGH